MTTFERIVTFRPAFDRRSPDPSKNYGVQGVELVMLLKGKAGAVQFVLYTNWHLPQVREDLKLMGSTMEPLPADIGYHSPRPRYPDQRPMPGVCPHVAGGVCYYDGSSLQARDVFELLIREGDEAVWKLLEQRYHEWLETPPEDAP
jgi:hypothetical protein